MSDAPKVKNRAKTSNRDPSSLKRQIRKEEEETRRTAAVILEVLAGLRTTAEASEALGVSVPRYYALEARAVEGLVAACRRRAKDPSRSAERRVKKLEVEIARLRSENARSQALLRVAQRAVGVKAPPPGGESKTSTGRKKRRKRKPTARALRAARVLREPVEKKAVEAAPQAMDHGPECGT